VLEDGEMIPHSNAAMSGDGQCWQVPSRQIDPLLPLPALGDTSIEVTGPVAFEGTRRQHKILFGNGVAPAPGLHLPWRMREASSSHRLCDCPGDKQETDN